MSGKARKGIMLSVMVSVLCVAVIVAVLAVTLWGKSKKLPHISIEDGGIAIVRGELDLSLMRESLETLTLNKDGVPVRKKEDKPTDFSKSDGNIFGIEDNILIGPGCYFTAQMTIANKKPYAFEYWLEIIPENGESLLVDQLEITVICGGEVFIQRTLQDGLNTKVLPKAAEGEKAEFTVTMKYLHAPDNNLTQNTTLAFDMIVHARLTES